jgi:hypothetical protein
MTRSGSQAPVSIALGDYRWLVSDDAARWLEIARAELANQRQFSAAFVARLRKDLSAERAHLIVEQAELRQRASAKFALADRMFFTRRALEQATDEAVAACKAMRISAAGPVLDLCCGIGGDLLALARQTKAIGVELDPIAALCAQANAAAHGFSHEQCSVKVANVRQADLTMAQAWHCDPDRRASGGRTSKIELGEPGSEQLERFLAGNSAAAIKLAPAAHAPPGWNSRAEFEWLGSRGECRQQVAWFGALAHHPGQQAATIADAESGPRTVVGVPGDSLPVASQLARYLYEPDASVLAAKLVNTLCAEHAVQSVSAGIAYLTGDQPIRDAALDSFEIVDVLPLDQKQLRAYCRERGLGRLEVKKRGVDVDVERLRKEIVSQGDNEATLILSPVLGRPKAIVARRIVAE